MKKVYVVLESWEGNSIYTDMFDSTSGIVGVANSPEEAAEMCRNARKEKIAGILAEKPKRLLDIHDKGEGVESEYYIGFPDDPDWYLGTFTWYIRPFDLIGS